MLQNNFKKIFSFSGSFRKNETILKEFGYVQVVVKLSTSARPLWGGIPCPPFFWSSKTIFKTFV